MGGAIKGWDLKEFGWIEAAAAFIVCRLLRWFNFRPQVSPKRAPRVVHTGERLMTTVEWLKTTRKESSTQTDPSF
jgi:hypothetical protein